MKIYFYLNYPYNPRLYRSKGALVPLQMGAYTVLKGGMYLRV